MKHGIEEAPHGTRSGCGPVLHQEAEPLKAIFFLSIFLMAVAPALGQAGTLHGVMTDPSGSVARGATVSLIGRAQVAKGTLSGTVRASGGSRIPMARVLIQNTATGLARSVTANRSGFYHESNLPPGEYEVIATAPGFVAARVTVSVAAGARQVANLVLGIHQNNPAATGQASVSAVQGVVNSQSVQELPLNGRSASNLATLQPGVSQARTAPTANAMQGFGTEMVISGQRPRQNDYTLDGISVNDYANAPPGSAAGVNLGADATKDFSVITSNYPAQYGRSSGGIIAQTTRSGTNGFHGDVFEYIRNSALDARNYFDSIKPPFRRNQFGGTIGGPIRRKRAFFFASYEGFRQSQGLTFVDDVPSQAARQGNLSTGTITVDPKILQLLNAFYPLPNRGLLGNGDTGVFAFAGQQVTPENYFTTRVDDKLTSRDSLSGVYLFDAGSVRQPDEFNNKETGYNSRHQFFLLSETHTFGPTLLNAFRFGVNRVVVNAGLTFPGANPNATDPAFGGVPRQNAPGVESVPGLTGFTGGVNSNGSQHFHFTDVQAYDDVSWQRGRHAFKFGASIERLRDNILADNHTAGNFFFNSLFDFLTNQPAHIEFSLIPPLSERGFRQTIVGAYAEDDWQVRSNLTLALGLRYEMATVMSEVHGHLTTLRSLTDAQPHLGSPIIYNPTLGNFEPRVGVSWDPFGNGRTAVRAGFGMFDVLPLPYLFELTQIYAAPFYDSGSSTSLPPGSFPAGVPLTPNDFRQAYYQPRPERNYVMQWNLNIEQTLSKDFMMSVAYVGSRGLHEPIRVDDANIVLPTLTTQGYLWPSPAGSGTRLNPNVGEITGCFWTGDSYYDGLEVHLRGKFGQGSQAGLSYTWGKAIDTGSSSTAGDEFPNSIASPLWFDVRRYRGLAAFDTAQDLTASYILNLGTPKRIQGIGRWALGGWAVGGIFEASTGTPFTPVFGGDPLGVNSSSPSVDVPNFVNAPGCSSSQVNPGNPLHYIKTQCFAVPNPITLLGNLGRNTLIGPGLVNLDFSMFKNNYVKRISDAFNVQFRAEFFNVLNHANFAPPLDNRALFDAQGKPLANAGEITGTQTPAREIQFALKMIW